MMQMFVFFPFGSVHFKMFDHISMDFVHDCDFDIAFYISKQYIKCVYIFTPTQENITNVSQPSPTSKISMKPMCQSVTSNYGNEFILTYWEECLGSVRFWKCFEHKHCSIRMSALALFHICMLWFHTAQTHPYSVSESTWLSFMKNGGVSLFLAHQHTTYCIHSVQTESC